MTSVAPTTTRKRARSFLDDDSSDEAATPTKVLRTLQSSLRANCEPIDFVDPPSTPTPRRNAKAASTIANRFARTPNKVTVLTESFKQTKATSCLSPKTNIKVCSMPSTPSNRNSKRTAGSSIPGTPRTPKMVFHDAKALFRRCTTPSKLVGRAEERAAISAFWRAHVLTGKGGSLYISGVPGTGKTALLDEMITDMRDLTSSVDHHVRLIKLNCMSLGDVKSVYTKLYTEISGSPVSAKDALKALDGIFVEGAPGHGSNTMYVVVLDEVDRLITKDQDILYQLFEWPMLAHSRLVLIGIANAIDLTDRFLPRLKAKNCEPQLLNFVPYDVKDISEIIKQRLHCLSTNNEEADLRENTPDTPTRTGRASGKASSIPLMQPMAIELCARKMAATGDLRKALDVCRQAIELVEAEAKTKLQSGHKVLTIKNLPTKSLSLDTPLDNLDELPKVTVKHILSATTNVFGSSNVHRMKNLSLQLKMVLCSLVVLGRQKRVEASLVKLYETYVRLCRTRDVGIIPVTKTELQDLITNLETSGLVTIMQKRSTGRRGNDGAGNQVLELTVRSEEIEKAVAGTPVLVNLLKMDNSLTE
ncbi:AAA ATPase [Gaertneriomyces sp. JEL0708]|nr:AAA ATPase [Gaertneriomyces sp. JEL0708]